MARYRAKQRTAHGDDAGQKLASNLIALKRFTMEQKESVRRERSTRRKQLAQRLQDGRARLRKKFLRLKDEMQSISESTAQVIIPQIKREACESMEQECVELCLRVAEEFLGETLPTHKRRLKRRIQAALKEVRASSALNLSLHPDDESIGQELKPLFEESLTVTLSTTQEVGKARITGNSVDLTFDWEDEFQRYALLFLTKYAEKRQAKGALSL